MNITIKSSFETNQRLDLMNEIDENALYEFIITILECAEADILNSLIVNDSTRFAEFKQEQRQVLKQIIDNLVLYKH
jgi:hypothetical protein